MGGIAIPAIGLLFILCLSGASAYGLPGLIGGFVVWIVMGVAVMISSNATIARLDRDSDTDHEV